jgi:hypothetical protein
MESPDKGQQDTGSEDLNSVLEAEYDLLDSAEEVEEDLSELEGEITEDVAEVSDEAEEVADKAELKEEIESAEESDYNEPAPQRWPEDIQKVYNELPPNARKAMLEGIYKPMQRSYTQTTTELAQQRDSIKPMIEVINQYRNDFERMGVSPVEAFRTQVAWAAHLSRVGAEQGLKDMQQAYGVGAPQQAEQGQEYLTPTERALKQQVDALSQAVQGQQQSQQQLTQQQEQAQQAAYKNEIQQNLNTFINEKTDDGKLAHPHVEKVASNIAGIIRGGLVRKVDEYGQPVTFYNQIAQAYSMACNLDPSIRTPVKDTRQAERVKAAQKVGVVTKAPAGHVSPDDDMPMVDFIEKQWEVMNRKTG